MKLIERTNVEFTTSPPLLGRCCYSQLFSFSPSIYKEIKMSNGVPESGAVICHSNEFPCWVAVSSFCNSFNFTKISLSELNFVSRSVYEKLFLIKEPLSKTIKCNIFLFVSISILLCAKSFRNVLYFLKLSKWSLYFKNNELCFFFRTLNNNIVLGSNINLGFTNSIKFNFNSLSPTKVVDNVSLNKNSMSINKDINIPRKWISSFDTSVFCVIVGLFTIGYNIFGLCVRWGFPTLKLI